MPWLDELLRDREKMMKLVRLAVLASIVLMTIGYIIIAQDLLG
jgi:hypothetical protein